MISLNKSSATVSFLAVAVFLASCSKTNESGNKYPRDFPEECVTAYDNHALFISKLRSSGRFDEVGIDERERKSFTVLETFKNPPRQRIPAMEEYIIACKMMNNLTLERLRGVDNMDNISDEELERIVGVFIKNSPRK